MTVSTTVFSCGPDREYSRELNSYTEQSMHKGSRSLEFLGTLYQNRR